MHRAHGPSFLNAIVHTRDTYTLDKASHILTWNMSSMITLNPARAPFLDRVFSGIEHKKREYYLVRLANPVKCSAIFALSKRADA